MGVHLRNSEFLVKDGPANLQRGVETVGGRLYLTNQRLIFKPHKLNIQSKVAEIEIGEVQSVQHCRTKLFGFIPTFANSLIVGTMDGTKLRFVVKNRDIWRTLILAQTTKPMPY